MYFFFAFYLEIMLEVKYRKYRFNFLKIVLFGGIRSILIIGKRTVVFLGSFKNEEDISGIWIFFSWFYLGICLIVMVYCGYKYVELMYIIYENNMWFFNIKVILYYNRDV